MGIMSVETLERGGEYLLELRNREEKGLILVMLNGVNKNTKKDAPYYGKHSFDFFEQPYNSFSAPAYYLHEGTYGQTWRVWDAGEWPDEETREAVKWDAGVAD